MSESELNIQDRVVSQDKIEHLNPTKQYLFHKITTKLKELVESCDTRIETKSHYLIQCPCCEEELNYHDAKLYIKKDYSTGYCQRCQSSYFNEEEKIDPDVPVQLTDLCTPRLRAFDFINKKFSVNTIDLSYYDLAKDTGGENYLIYRYSKDKFYKDITGYSGVIYKEPRIKLVDHAKQLGIKYRVNRVLIPYNWLGRTIYYQIRFTNPDAKPKYFNPVIENKPLYYCPLNTMNNSVGILVEGVFGAIAASFNYELKYNTYATMGSYLTDYQFWMLEQLGLQKLVLYFDDWDISYHIYKQLIKKNPLKFKNTEIIRSPLGDPEFDYLAGIKGTIHPIDWAYKRTYF